MRTLLAVVVLVGAFGCALDSGKGRNPGGVGGGSSGFGGGGFGGFGGGGTGTGGSAGMACESLSNKVINCGLATSGVLGGACAEPGNAQDSCEANCALASDCADLTALFCSGASDVISNCVLACAGQPDFQCADGGTTFADFQCDGDLDCFDGSDELNCPSTSFLCDDGLEEVSADLQCNDFPDCFDGSDEVNCLQLFCPL